MTRKTFSFQMATTCVMVIAAPGRFSVGIMLSLEILFLMVFVTLFRFFIRFLRLKKLESISLCAFIVSCAMFFKEFLAFLMPDMALQLSFVIFLPAVSSFPLCFLLDDKTRSIKETLKVNIVPTAISSGYMICISFLRDILGYGTITFPSFGKVIEKVIFKGERITWLSFVATIPGALLLSAILLMVYLSFEKKIDILKRLGFEDD